jgi:uncharacterized protein YegP (UPF0339 family)
MGRKPMASVQYQLHKASNGQYWWRVVSLGNYKVLASSETYVARSDAVHAANLVREGSSGADFFDQTGES